MKKINYVALLTCLLSVGSVVAVTKETEKYAKKSPKHTKHETRKNTHSKATSHKTQKHASTKAVQTKTHTPKAPAANQPANRKPHVISNYHHSATMPESTSNKVSQWLGLGAAGTAGTAAAISHHGREAGYRTGPRDWHHNFPTWWADRGWTAQDVGGIWYFAGYPLDWWEKNYPTYYKDAVRDEYAKTHK